MKKRELLAGLMSRIDAALAAGQFFEASWYVSALLEDRLSSILRSTGGEGDGGIGDPMKMLGPKVMELDRRAGWGPHANQLIVNSPWIVAAYCWKEDRNRLMHCMADGTISIPEIDVAKERLARDGKALLKEAAALAQRLKKHRQQTPSVAGAAKNIVPRPRAPGPTKAPKLKK